MYFIGISEISQREARSLGYLTGMRVVYDKRFKRYELRGTKKNHKKFLKTIEEFAKIKKGEVWDWVEKESKYKSESQFTEIK